MVRNASEKIQEKQLNYQYTNNSIQENYNVKCKSTKKKTFVNHFF